jgi:rhodanese-related sulfurtransferase
MIASARRHWWPQILLLSAISIMAAWVVNVGRPEPLPWWADFAVKKTQEAVRVGIAVVTLEEGKAALSSGQRLFVDARTPDEFAAGHVPGAVNIPAELLETGLDEAVSGLAKDKPMLLYCGDLSCPKSKELAEALKAMGFTDLSLMPEGFEGWKAGGGPVEAK